MYHMKMRQDIALGNGTRKRGEVLASIELQEGATLESLLAAVNADDDLPADIQTAEGVVDAELQTLLRNAHLCDFVRDAVEVLEEEIDEDEDLPYTTIGLSTIGLDEPIVKALGDAGLATIQDVLEHGGKHGTLTNILGIGKASETKVQDAIEKAELNWVAESDTVTE